MQTTKRFLVGYLAISVLLVAPVQPAAAASPSDGPDPGGNQTVISPSGLPEAVYASTNGASPSSAALDPSLPCTICPHYITYVYFTCPDGTITLSGVGTVCHDVSGETLGYTCKSSSGCSLGMSGADDSGYFFYGWDDSTYATISGQGQSVSLNVATTFAVESGSVTYINGPTLTMMAETFVNWSTPWSYGMVQVCPNNPFNVCHSRSSSGAYGDQLLDPQGFTYTVTPQNATPVGVGAGLPEYWVVHQWNSTMGDAIGLSYDHATMYFQNSGIISMYATSSPRATTNWAGFVYAPSASTGPIIYQASATFYVPNATAGDSADWVGIGGVSSSLDLWQAGICVSGGGSYCPSSSLSGAVQAWWDEAGTGCNPCAPQYLSLSVSSGDQVEVTVSSAGGQSTYWINDSSNLKSVTNAGSPQSWTPYAMSGEWIDEPSVSRIVPFTYFTGLSINAAPATLQNPYMVPTYYWTASISQLCFSGTNGASFSERTMATSVEDRVPIRDTTWLPAESSASEGSASSLWDRGVSGGTP